MWKWAVKTGKQTPKAVIYNIAAALILSGGTSVAGLRQSIPVYLYLPLITATLAFSLMTGHYILLLRDRYRRQNLGVKEEDLEGTITDWLIDAGLQVQKLQAQNAFFHISAKDSFNREYRVVRLRDLPSEISIYEGYELSAEQLKAIELLPKDVYAQIAEDMRISIAAFDIEVASYAPIQSETSAQGTAFYVRDRVAFAYLFNSGEFYQRLGYVKRASTVVSVYLLRMLRHAEM